MEGGDEGGGNARACGGGYWAVISFGIDIAR
jgi:hypothetical protein